MCGIAIGQAVFVEPKGFAHLALDSISVNRTFYLALRNRKTSLMERKFFGA